MALYQSDCVHCDRLIIEITSKNHYNYSKNMERRSFLKRSAAGAALFTILPRQVLGKMGGANNFVAPSDQLTRGIIGVGGIGRSDLHFASDQRCRLTAICDVDQKHLDSAFEAAKKSFNETVKTYHDFRELIHDENVDIVHIAHRLTGTASWPLRQRTPVRTSSARSL